MREGPFHALEEVDQYLYADQIECLECGRFFSFLPRHITRAHQMDAGAYRDKWAIPASRALAGRDYREQHSAKLRRMISDGSLIPAHEKATEAAKEAGSRRKVTWQTAAQAARVAALRPGDHSLLPAGAKRKDGRDAARARDYQRLYRARRPTA